MKKAIALSADYGYIRQLTTTVKSILYHNRNCDLYIINNDIPQEWFYNINRQIQALNSQLIDLKIDSHMFDDEASTHDHINNLTYGRLLIPQLIKANRVLYIDSDAVVNDDLTPLFKLEMGNHHIAAVHDVFYDIFNAGVLLFNNQLIRQDPDIVHKYLQDGQNQDLTDADQSVLNDFYNHKYLELPIKYNYVVGYDSFVFYSPHMSPNYDHIMNISERPVIIHYASIDKPWLTTSSGRMRDRWWQYANLDWYQIVMRLPLPNDAKPYQASVLTFTDSDNLLHLKELVQALPQIRFRIAAWTKVSPQLLKMISYPNVELAPTIAGQLLNEWLRDACAYLDINAGNKEFQFMKQMNQAGKPVLSFSGVVDNSDHLTDQLIFEDHDVQGMIKQIQECAK